MITSDELRQLGSTLFRALRDAAAQIDRATIDALRADAQEQVYEEVIKNLASKEREKLQKEMAKLRGRITALNKRVVELEDENKKLRNMPS